MFGEKNVGAKSFLVTTLTTVTTVATANTITTVNSITLVGR